MLWEEVALGACTVLFAIPMNPLGVVVAINGVLCHGSYAFCLPFAPRVRLWDVGCNALMALYVNFHGCAQPTCGLLTILACVAWRCNQYTRSAVRKAIVHALFVQLPLLDALGHFIDHCSNPI